MLTTVEQAAQRRAMKLKTVAKPRNYPQEISGQSFALSPDGSLRPVEARFAVPSHHGFYVLLEDCGHLSQPGDGEFRRCTAYDERPGACRAYQVGSDACLAARASFGLDGHEAVPDEYRDDPEKLRAWSQQQAKR